MFHDRALARQTLDEIPMNGILGFLLNYPVVKHQISQPYPRRVQNIPRAILSESSMGSGATPDGCARAHPLANRNTPGRFYPNHPGAQRLHLTGALARTLWRIKIPPGRFCPNHLGATPVGCAHTHPLANQNTPRGILSESPEGSGATVGDLISGYPMRWN